MIENAHIYFPQVDLNDIYLYTYGSYQIKMANKYVCDHLSDDGEFHCQIAKETSEIDFCKYGIHLDFCHSSLLKARIHSRHFNHIKYYVYLCSFK